MRSSYLFAVTIAVALGFASSAQAQAQQSTAIDPQAKEALQNMGRHLQSLRSFSVKARSSTDQVLTTGEKIELDAEATIWATRPNRLRVDSKSDRRSRQIFYDGTRFTVFGKATGFYATVPAPATLRELQAKISEDYGLELPLADLFAWGSDTEQHADLTAASAIGLATIRGIACDQYAFRQEGLDWQVWIQRGPRPLPRRLVLTTTTDEARPQYRVDLDWEPEAKLSPAIFKFTPPAGARPIPLRRIDEPGAPTR